MEGPAHEDAVRDVEEAFVAHWSIMGAWPGAELIDEDGLLRFRTQLRALPYNGVIRTTLGGGADEAIARVAREHAARGADVFWAVMPSARPADLAARLTAAGIPEVEAATGMYLDLAGGPGADPGPPEGVRLTEVRDDAGLAAYEDLMMRYWELGDADREQIVRLNRHWSGSRARGARWLAWVDGHPAGKGYLSFAGPPGVAAIFGMSVLPEARGRGIAGALTRALVRRAHEAGHRRVVLHSSAMAEGVYRRAGFAGCCRIGIHATSAIWSGDH